MVDVVFGGGLDDEQRQHLEDLINEEIEKAGIADRARVAVNDGAALMSFVPSWDTELTDAIDAGIEQFRAEE